MIREAMDPSCCAERSNGKKRPRRVGLSCVAEARLRDKLRSRCPSSPWIDEQFKSYSEVDPHGRATIHRYHDPSVFPPGGAQTAMVRCPECNVYTPPNAMENGLCLDHAPEPCAIDPRLGWGRSPSAVAIEALQFRNLRLIDSELAPESATALREEIEIEVEREKARRR